MLTGSLPKTEGRRGSQRRLEEGGRYLGIPRKGDFGLLRDEREDVTTHNCGVLSVQETGCDTAVSCKFHGPLGMNGQLLTGDTAPGQAR
jgi:hypothetical protein